MIEFVKNDDKLFRDDLPDIRHNAVLKYAFQQFCFYADGYRIAAYNLVTTCVHESQFGRGDVDVLIYPIVFNYRQYVELRLKEIVSILRYCAGERNNCFSTHGLKALWEEVKTLYQDFIEESADEDFANVERIILEFDYNDPISMTYRYPLTKNGQEMNIQNAKLNVRNFGEVMERLATFLDSLSDMAKYYSDIKDSIDQ